MIDRCHCGGNPKFYKDNNKHRPIYPTMHRWKDYENVNLGGAKEEVRTCGLQVRANDDSATEHGFKKGKRNSRR